MHNKEELASKKRAVELYDSGKIGEFEVGTTEGLKQIHRFIFQDVFDFAGEIRNVDLAKGNFRFAPVIYLRDSLNTIDALPEDSFEEIIKKYVEMNVAHPFREGNGRATRIWLDQILKKRLGKCVDWSRVGKEEYLSAMERSPINDLEIRMLLSGALTDEVDNREVYMRGIQSSYEYEEQAEYDVHKIVDERNGESDETDVSASEIVSNIRWLSVATIVMSVLTAAPFVDLLIKMFLKVEVDAIYSVFVLFFGTVPCLISVILGAMTYSKYRDNKPKSSPVRGLAIFSLVFSIFSFSLILVWMCLELFHIL